MSTRGFLIEILLHIYNVQQIEVIFSFLFNCLTHKLCKHLVEVYDYDVMTSKIIQPIAFRNYTKYPTKVLQKKNNII